MVIALVVLCVVTLLLLAGPLRRSFLAHWRFTFPAALGFVGGLGFTAWLVSFGLPTWLYLIGPPFCALQFGAGAKAWLDENLGPPKH